MCDKQRSKSGKSFAFLSTSRRSSVSLGEQLWSAENLYPMYAMSVPELLKMTEFLPHQELLHQGKLVRCTDQMAGRVIFVSHQ